MQRASSPSPGGGAFNGDSNVDAAGAGTTAAFGRDHSNNADCHPSGTGRPLEFGLGSSAGKVNAAANASVFGTSPAAQKKPPPQSAKRSRQLVVDTTAPPLGSPSGLPHSGRARKKKRKAGPETSQDAMLHPAPSIMLPPSPAKKRWLVTASAVAAAGVGVATTSRAATLGQKPRLSAELLARVASYSSLGRDLLNLCVVAGPEDCAVIRHAYLHNNFRYLTESLDSYTGLEKGTAPMMWATMRVGSDLDWETCRDRYRAWMTVNIDWRKHVTDERVERLKMACIRSRSGQREVKSYVMCHPFVPLCNPAVAIELRLQEVLVYFVEEKGIDLNSYRWNNYQCFSPGYPPYHLLVACMICENIEAFRYLLGRKDIDINSYSTETHDDCWMSHWTFMEVALDMRCCTDFVRELLAHPNFDMVASFTNSAYTSSTTSPLHYAIDILDKDGFLDRVPLPTWKAKFRLLLSAGADPHMEDDGLDAIQYAKEWLREKPESQALKDAVEILEDWVAIK